MIQIKRMLIKPSQNRTVSASCRRFWNKGTKSQSITKPQTYLYTSRHAGRRDTHTFLIHFSHFDRMPFANVSLFLCLPRRLNLLYSRFFLCFCTVICEMTWGAHMKWHEMTFNYQAPTVAPVARWNATSRYCGVWWKRQPSSLQILSATQKTAVPASLHDMTRFLCKTSRRIDYNHHL